MLNLAQKIKDNYPDTICLIDCGMFYRCYDEDAYIISYLLGYKLKSITANDMAGFPNSSIKEVTNRLMGNKIDYKIFKMNQMSLDILDSFSVNEDNNYEFIYQKSYRYTKLKSKINRLSQELIKRIENKKMDEILEKIDKIIINELK